MNMTEKTTGYRCQMRKLDEHTDVYLYEEKYGDHHQELDLMSKQPVED